MNRIILTTIAVLFFGLTAFAQSNGGVDSIIQSIRKEFTSINDTTKKYRIDSVEVEGLSTEGGSLKKYYEGNVLRKAVLLLYGETGQLICEYYFSGNKLIFCYEKNETNDKHINEGKPKVIATREERFYFHDHKLVRWINGKTTMEKSAYPDKEKEILISVREDLKISN